MYHGKFIEKSHRLNIDQFYQKYTHLLSPYKNRRMKNICIEKIYANKNIRV
jgi:hypothetical protein